MIVAGKWVERPARRRRCKPLEGRDHDITFHRHRHPVRRRGGGGAQHALAQGYEFVNIVDSRDARFNTLGFANPVLNDAGQVAFYNSRGGPGTNPNGFYRADATTGVTVIADATSSLVSGESFFGQYDLNNTGTVVFNTLRIDGQFAVYTGNGGPATLTAQPNTGNGHPQINDSGVITYSSFQGIRRVLPGGTDDFVAVSGHGRLNDLGDIAYGADSQQTIRVRSVLDLDAPSQTVGEGVAGRFASPNFAVGLDFNNAGDVLFSARLDGETTSGLFLGRAGVATSTDIALASGFDLDSGAGVAIGDDGTIAFVARPRAGGPVSLYVTDTSATTPVPILTVGDAFDGLTLQDLRLRPGAVNANGEIAFSYGLSTSTQFARGGIAIAVIPEPGMLGLLAAGGLGLLRRRWR